MYQMYVSRFRGDEDVVLRLPPGRRVSDLKWVSWSCYVLIIYGYPCGVLKTPLSRFRNTLIFLLRWLSVWCREYAVDFGHTGIDAWRSSPVLSPNKFSVHSVDIVGILSARYLFLSNVEVILWERQIALLELEFRWSSSFTWRKKENLLWIFIQISQYSNISNDG